MREANAFINKAIEYCMLDSRGPCSRDEVVASLKTHNSLVHSRFRLSIAQNVAKSLMDEFGSCIKALRLYGSTMEYMAGVYSDIDILVRVTGVSGELRESLKSMNSLLSEGYYKLLGKDPSEWSYLLDVHIINDDPSEQRSPSAAYLEHIMDIGSIALN